MEENTPAAGIVRLEVEKQRQRQASDLIPRNKRAGKPSLEPLPDGPFRYENPLHPEGGRVYDSSGREIPCGPSVMLCRCGKSSKKPFCDGTHARTGFHPENQSDRRLDHRRSYAGRGITVHDNRSICSHAGVCWRGLPTVFSPDKRPWIDPDGAGPEEIIRVVEGCPSGALSYSVDGVEHRDLPREPSVTVTRNGPYWLVGGIEVACDEPRAEEVSLEHCSCCRCGASRNQPFCDGSHLQVGFQDEEE